MDRCSVSNVCLPNIYQNKPNQLFRTIETNLNGVTRQITIPVLNDESSTANTASVDETVSGLPIGINATPIKIEPRDDWLEEQREDMGLQISDVTSLQAYLNLPSEQKRVHKPLLATQDAPIFNDRIVIHDSPQVQFRSTGNHALSSTQTVSSSSKAAGIPHASEKVNTIAHNVRLHAPPILQRGQPNKSPRRAPTNSSGKNDKIYSSAAVPARPFAHGVPNVPPLQKMPQVVNQKQNTDGSSTAIPKDIDGPLKTSLNTLVANNVIPKNRNVIVGPFNNRENMESTQAKTAETPPQLTESLKIGDKRMPIQTITSNELNDNQAKVFIYVGTNPDGSVQYKTFDIFATPDGKRTDASPPSEPKPTSNTTVTQTTAEQPVQVGTGNGSHSVDMPNSNIQGLPNVVLQGMKMPDGTIVLNNPNGQQGIPGMPSQQGPVVSVQQGPIVPVQQTNLMQSVQSVGINQFNPASTVQGVRMSNGAIMLNNIPVKQMENNIPVTVPASSLVIPKSAGGTISTMQHLPLYPATPSQTVAKVANVTPSQNGLNIFNQTIVSGVNKSEHIQNIPGIGQCILQQTPAGPVFVPVSSSTLSGGLVGQTNMMSGIRSLPSSLVVTQPQTPVMPMMNTISSVTPPNSMRNSAVGLRMPDGSIVLKTQPVVGTQSTLQSTTQNNVTIVSASNLVIPKSAGGSITTTNAHPNTNVQGLPNTRTVLEPTMRVTSTISSNNQRTPIIDVSKSAHNFTSNGQFVLKNVPSGKLPQPTYSSTASTANTLQVQNSVSGNVQQSMIYPSPLQPQSSSKPLMGYIDQQGRLVINQLEAASNIQSVNPQATAIGQAFPGIGKTNIVVPQTVPLNHTSNAPKNNSPIHVHRNVIGSKPAMRLAVNSAVDHQKQQELTNTKKCVSASDHHKEKDLTIKKILTSIRHETEKHTTARDITKKPKQQNVQLSPGRNRTQKCIVEKATFLIDGSSSEEERNASGTLSTKLRQTDINIGREKIICPKPGEFSTVKVCDIEPDIELISSRVNPLESIEPADDIQLMKVGYNISDSKNHSTASVKDNTSVKTINSLGGNDDCMMEKMKADNIVSVESTQISKLHTKCNSACNSEPLKMVHEDHLKPCTVLLESLNLQGKLSFHLQGLDAFLCAVCNKRHAGNESSLTMKRSAKHSSQKHQRPTSSDMSDAVSSTNSSDSDDPGSDEDYFEPKRKRIVIEDSYSDEDFEDMSWMKNKVEDSYSDEDYVPVRRKSKPDKDKKMISRRRRSERTRKQN